MHSTEFNSKKEWVLVVMVLVMLVLVVLVLVMVCVCLCVCLDGGMQGCLLSQYSNSHQNTKTAILQTIASIGSGGMIN